MMTAMGDGDARIVELRGQLARRDDDFEARAELVVLLMDRLAESGERPREVLTEVIGLLRTATDLAVGEHAEWRSMVLAELGDALARRFWLTVDEMGDVPVDDVVLGDLHAAIEAMQNALAAASEEDTTEIAGNLGALYRTRFLARSAEKDLESAIRLLARATTTAEPDLTDAVELGRALADRYDLHGDRSDRDGAIRWLRRVYDVLALPDDAYALDHLRLAELLIGRGETLADVTDVSAGIGYAQRSLAGLPGGDPGRAHPLYVLGIGHLVRAEIVPASARDDLPIAVDHLRESGAALPDDHPGHGEVAARLAVALGAWVHNDLSEAAADVTDALRERADQAVRLLTAARRDMPVEDPFRLRVHYRLAMALAQRFIYLGGGDDDHQAALAEFEAVLEWPGLDVDIADICRVFLAYLLLVRWVPEEMRQSPIMPDPSVVTRMMGSLPERLTPDAAQAALDHLNQVSESGAANPFLTGFIPSVRALARISLGLETLAPEELGPAIADFEEALRQTPEGDPDGGELRGMLGLLYGLRARRSENAADSDQAVESLTAAIEQFGDRHPMRPLLLGVLGGAFPLPLGDRAASREESTAAAELLERALDRLPDDHPQRAAVLMRLGGILIQQSMRFDRSPAQLEKVRRLLGEAVARPPADPANEAINHCLLGMIDGHDALLDLDGGRLNAAVERFEHAAGLVPPGHQIQDLVRVGRISLLLMRYARGGELESLKAATHYADQATRTGDGDDPTDSLILARYFLAFDPVIKHRHTLDRGHLDETITHLEALRARLPEDHHLHSTMTGDLSMLRMLRSGFGPDGPDPRAAMRDPTHVSAAADVVVAMALATPHDDVFYPVNLGAAGNARVAEGFARRDRRLINEGITMLAEAYKSADFLPGYREHIGHMLAMGLRMRYEVTRDRTDLSHAVDRLEEARRLADQGPGDTDLARTLYLLALCHHERDDQNLNDRRRAIEAGIDALRARTGAVMLQSRADRAFDAALAAAGEASDVARWCLAGGDTEAAVQALERGRAMVLHAATADADIPLLLHEAGHQELAVEWETELREAGPTPPWDDLPDMTAAHRRLTGTVEPVEHEPGAQLPSHLRYRVMRALQGTEVERRLLRPPGIAEIAGALHAAGAEALVYLLPQDEGGGGLAVVVDADRNVGELSLPLLTTGPRSRVAAFAEAQRDWQNAKSADDSKRAEKRIRRRWGFALGDLCDWAWTAAMEQILDSLAGDPLRRARLLLVPVGDLSLVPWHAARRTVAGGSHRYACQDVIISYAASARQFVDACRHPGPRRPWHSAAALVRTGESELYWASKEIEEIHRRHYPHGTLLGGRGHRRSPRSTPENVRARLPRLGEAGASLLHLGCHAVPGPRPVDARLLLANGGSLSMSDILRQARERPRDTPGGLVVLAACGSDLTSRHHDETLTLATSFLAAGAVGVVGTRWPVDDVPTSVFMTMFHHYLNSGYDDPATALRAVQVWMLTPERSFPEGFHPKYAEMMRGVDLLQVDAWAAFTYQGR